MKPMKNIKSLTQRERLLAIGMGSALAMALAVRLSGMSEAAPDPAAIPVRTAERPAVKPRPEPVPARSITQDPFASRIGLPAKSEGKGEANRGPQSGLPRLQGIYAEAARNWAILDGQARGVGDQVGPYVVEKIDSECVVLRGPQGSVVLSVRAKDSGRL